MVQPRLLHPVPIVIQQMDQSTTMYDDDYREPIQQSQRFANVTLPGQVKWTVGLDELKMERGGVRLEAEGYVLFRYKDLKAKNITLKKDDRLITIGGVEVDVYITKIQPMGHYPSAAGPTLVRAWFNDRQPNKQGKGIKR